MPQSGNSGQLGIEGQPLPDDSADLGLDLTVAKAASSLCLVAVVTTASSHCCLRLITVTSLSLYLWTVITALTTAPSPSLRL